MINENVYRNLAQGPTQKAQSTTAMAVGAKLMSTTGYFKATLFINMFVPFWK